MFFLLTNFIYPIKKPVKFSRYFNFVFDNPRTKDEIEIVSGLIEKAWTSSETFEGFKLQRFPMEKEVKGQSVVTFEKIIKDFMEFHYGNDFVQKEIKKIEGDKNKIIEFYAKNWVIARYGNQEMIKENERLKNESKKMKKKGIRGLIMLEDDHIFETREDQLINFSHLLSLLSGNEEYYGWNFLMTETRYEVYEYSPKLEIMYNILIQALGLKSMAKNDPSKHKLDFSYFWNSVKKHAELIDARLNKSEIEEDEILYMGNILREAKPHENEYSSLVRLTSLIEMLVTHQPDFNRFNVEESITKQFILKTAILDYLFNNKKSLNKIKDSLKEIYKQRSNIVHGNFSEVDKFKKKLNKEEKYFSELISESYNFCRIVLIKYLEDPVFVKFLKNN